ncbi:ABC transporter substrate-binding protein [Cereibacter sphaeroides]|uniref:ABC transporter substrate-binding protein n=1 Tax=Cereibacter sphaeroides TaxID=1063 RepID=A0AAX1UQT1_CERSP|nr:ABC transporter substrate-binding protein [Cereibacter sphaeroides]EKX59804.1 ABC-type nitrate/sulfonate/bicarbonate transport system, periplasmic component [Rhodobacter sp. AKP1]ACM03203.1 WD-40 repeat protein precursor [Cereibacter sphaeroides KD131]EGJ19901.1 WD-40 repeat protein precursor [Cereibacter sphaeroides WS8N]MWP37006.1 PhnD/SsuA/transferrin family substrate-binding protein [Cereibacter sphaeroides]RHZ98576.1 ABC transporter substrate-binding protein [Cereibacter sphaeroides]
MTSTTRLSRRSFGLLTAGSVASLAIGAPSLIRAQTAVNFAVPNPSALTWLPYWVAVGEGYFAEEGFEPRLEAIDGSSAVLQAMSAGQAQIGAPGPGPTLGARARGVDVKFLYNLYPKSVFGLLVKEDSAYQTPADLKGQVIGVGTADGAEVSFTRAILTEAGMAEGADYSFLPVGDGGTAAVAFLRDEVAAYAGAVSDAAILAARGLTLREITPEAFLGFFGNGIAMLESQMQAMPELAPAFGRALVRGTRFASDPANKEKALAHCAAGNPQEGEQDYAASLYDGVVNRMTPTEAFIGKGYGYQPPEHWQAIHDSAVASGALSEPIEDLASVYTNEFVEGWNS